MPKRSSNPDLNVTAFNIVQQVTGAADSPPPETAKEMISKYAKAIGRLGGLKGGVARAKALSASERKEIARKAAQARWAKKPNA